MLQGWIEYTVIIISFSQKELIEIPIISNKRKLLIDDNILSKF